MKTDLDKVLGIQNLKLEELELYGKPVGHFAVTDGSECYGVVSKRYEPVTHQKALARVQEYLPEGRVENVYTSKNLSRAVFNIRLPEVYEVSGSAIKTYVNLRNSLDGGWTLGLIVSPIRVVCQNTFVLHFSEALIDIGERHTKNGVKKFFDEVPVVELVYKTLEGQIEIAKKLAARSCSTSKGKEFLEKLAEKKILPARISKNAAELYENPKRKDDEGRDFWSLFNATTDVLSRNLEDKGRLSTLDHIYRVGEVFSELVKV